MKSILTKMLVLSLLVVLPVLAEGVGVHESSAQPTRVNQRYDTLGICSVEKKIGQIDPEKIKNGDHNLDVRENALHIFGKDPDINEIDTNNSIVTVLAPPEHGELSNDLSPGKEVFYVPKPGYTGEDKVIFSVNMLGHNIEVRYYINTVDFDSADTNILEKTWDKYCPDTWWIISSSSITNSTVASLNNA